jgi:hypothetical protein
MRPTDAYSEDLVGWHNEAHRRSGLALFTASPKPFERTAKLPSDGALRTLLLAAKVSIRRHGKGAESEEPEAAGAATTCNAAAPPCTA